MTGKLIKATGLISTTGQHQQRRVQGRGTLDGGYEFDFEGVGKFTLTKPETIHIARNMLRAVGIELDFGDA